MSCPEKALREVRFVRSLCVEELWKLKLSHRETGWPPRFNTRGRAEDCVKSWRHSQLLQIQCCCESLKRCESADIYGPNEVNH